MSTHDTPISDEDLRQLEKELASLRPLAPPAHFHDRVMRGLREGQAVEDAKEAQPQEKGHARRWRAGFIPLAAAAAVALLAAVLVDPPAAPSGGASASVTGSPGSAAPGPAGPSAFTDLQLLPVSLESELVGERDEGIHREDERAYIIVRRTYLETRVLRDRHSDALVEIQVPREELVRVPVRTN